MFKSIDLDNPDVVTEHLAKSELQRINETSKALSKDYKPTWVAFNSLEKKKLIIEAGTKEYRNRGFPVFWLIGEGIITAMFEGAELTPLLEVSKRSFPDEVILLCFLEVLQLVNPKVIELAYKVVKNKGEMEYIDLLTRLVSIATFEDAEKMKKVVAVLKKYPEIYE